MLIFDPVRYLKQTLLIYIAFKAEHGLQDIQLIAGSNATGLKKSFARKKGRSKDAAMDETVHFDNNYDQP